MQNPSKWHTERHTDNMPDTKVRVREAFGLDSDLEVPAFNQPSEHVPEVDADGGVGGV